MDLIGRKVRKRFPKFGVFNGVIHSFDAEAGFYKVVYEDGDSEDVDLTEVQSMLIEASEGEIHEAPEEKGTGNGDSDSNLKQDEKGSEKNTQKRRRISELGNETPVATPVRRSARQAKNAAQSLVLSTPETKTIQTKEKKNLGSVSNSRKRMVRKKVSDIIDHGPKLDLPPSSKNLDLEGIPVLDFFVVYSSLRSFSRQFFLSPFRVETFLNSLKCTFANPLIDSVHFSLLHALKKHLEILSEQGSQSAAHCIRNLNWDLLDQFTWPVFLAEYLLVHGSEIKPSIDLPNLKLLKTEYYQQPPEVKLELLRCLCDDVMEVDVIHSEIDSRTGESEPNGESSRPKKRGRKPKNFKKEVELEQALNAEPAPDEDDKNIDECFLCTMDGNLLCCDGCPNAFHSRCVGVAKDSLPEGAWYCPECSVGTKDKITKTPPKVFRGGDMLGVDPHGRVYFWTSDYLLVSESYENADSCNYYAKTDIISVLKVLNSYHSSYSTIIDAISSSSNLSLESSLNDDTPQDIEMSPRKETFHSDPSQEQNPTETMDNNYPIPQQTELETSNLVNSEKEKLVLVPNLGKTGDKISDPTRYINSYSFGRLAFYICLDFLRILSENKEQKKPIEDITILQKNAIYNMSPSFCWYSFQKFPIEIQKETCGWCFPCRAAETEFRFSNCVFETTFHDKQVENSNEPKSHISAAIHHFLLLEERLKGLLSGPWENPNFSEIWRNDVSRALDVKSLSKLLLQLENNLRRMVFLADWTRPVDSTAVVGSAVHISIRPANVSNNMLVRKPGRPGRKSTTRIGSSSNGGGSNKTESNVGINWWRGGRLSRDIFHWKRLPRSLVLKAARQGGLKKIPTIVYPEGSDVIARRIKCVAWRASLEMSQCFSHLIFLIKELESYLKWAEFGSSLPFAPVTTESKRAAKQFKKVIIWRKMAEGSNTKYLLDFGKKDKKGFIPPIVVKCGTKLEEPNNERIKYWLGENYVPLHLLKAYEEKKLVRLMKKKDGSTPKPSEKSKKKDVSTPKPSEKSKKKDVSTPKPSEKSKTKDASTSKLSEKKFKKKDGATPKPSDKLKKKDASTPKLSDESKEELTAPKSKAKSKSKKRVNLSDELGESASAATKRRRLSGFDHLFEKAEKLNTKQCGRCNGDVLVSEAVNCQSCEGYFHRKHFKLPKDISTVLFICIKCKDQSAKKPEPKKSPAKKKSDSSSKKKKKKNFNLKKKIEVRRSDRILAKKPLPKKKSKKKYKKRTKNSKPKITNIKPNNSNEEENEFTWPKRKRTGSPHSYWLNGLHWTRKNEEELNINFTRSKVLFQTENFEEIASRRPICSLCTKEYNSPSLFISCENCEEWFHGDAYQVKAENIDMLIGFKCHKCRKKAVPSCPHEDVPQEQNKVSGTSDLALHSENGNVGADEVSDFMNTDEASKPDPIPNTTVSISKRSDTVMQEQNKVSCTSDVAPCSENANASDFMNVDEASKPDSPPNNTVSISKQIDNVPQEQNKVSCASENANAGDLMNVDEASITDLNTKQNDWTTEFMYVVPQEDMIEAILGGPSSPLEEIEETPMEIENGFSEMDKVQECNGEPNGNGSVIEESKEEEKSNGEVEILRGGGE